MATGKTTNTTDEQADNGYGFNPNGTPRSSRDWQIFQAQEAARLKEEARRTDIGKIKTGDDGMRYINGGVNDYGFKRPDQYLMRDENNKIHDAFREKMGDSYNQLKTAGQGLMGDLDSRGAVNMGSAYGKLEQQAMGSGDLEQTAFMRDQLNNQTRRDLGRFDTQSLNNLNATQSQMAMRGGVSGGSAERMGRSAMRDQMMGKQNIQGQNRDQNLQLSINNANTRNDLLRDVGNVQQSNNQFNANAFTNQRNTGLETLKTVGNMEQGLESSNIGAARQDLKEQNLGQYGLYSEDMKAWGAKQTSDAQRNAGDSGGSCCFIFLEARYGNGTMDGVVRRYRDEYMTTQNRRGYYKVSEVLVPLMRKYKVVKLATRILMTDPMVAYGKAHYRVGSKLGLVFKPVVKFWLGMFDYIGGEHEFIRENGEIV